MVERRDKEQDTKANRRATISRGSLTLCNEWATVGILSQITVSVVNAEICMTEVSGIVSVKEHGISKTVRQC